MKLGLLFAGQGSQKVGMGADFYEQNVAFRDIFDLLPEELRNLAFSGPMETLSLTEHTQPVMVAFAAGVMAALGPELEKLGIQPQMAAGLSLGEYSALHSAGVFDAETAIRLVSIRGRAMADGAKGIDCRMTAVLGLERDVLKQCCEEAAAVTGQYVSIANYNCPGQIVIAGEAAAVDKAGELAQICGAKRCIALPVSGPFHTKFMEPVGEKLAEVFADMDFGNMAFPVLFNALGREKTESESVADLLIRQVSGSVYFEDSIKAMEAAGIDMVIEIGPGKALSGFVRKTCKGMRVLNIETVEDMEKVLATLKEA